MLKPEKGLLPEDPEDPTQAEAPPSYDTINGPNVQFTDVKGSGSHSHSVNPPPHTYPLSPGPNSPPGAPVKSPSANNVRGKSKASSGWFNFGGSKQTREVHATVSGLIRDLVREQETTGKAAFGILESCADVCSGYDLSLPDILQEKSIENHTPLYWAIVKRAPDGVDHGVVGIPDLLTALISFATPLNAQTIADVRHACLLTSDQLLFQRLRMSPAFSPLSGTDEMLLGVKIPPDDITVENAAGDEGAFVVDFSIGHFQKRMYVSQKIELDFIARGTSIQVVMHDEISEMNARSQLVCGN